jgi:hypothetical protein
MMSWLARLGRCVVIIFKRVTSIGYSEFPPPKVSVIDLESERKIRETRDIARTVRQRMEELEDRMRNIAERQNDPSHSSE